MTRSSRPATKVLGMVLAGGAGRRMEIAPPEGMPFDKGRQLLGGQSLIAHVIARLAPQVEALVINANGPPERFADLGLAVVDDGDLAGEGPLAGILAGLRAARDRGCDHLLSVACDTPFLPPDLRLRLARALERAPEAGVAMAASLHAGELEEHPVIALWPVGLEPALAQALAEGQRRVRAFARDQGLAEAAWSPAPHDPFLNINTRDQLARAEALLARSHPARTATAPRMHVHGITGHKNSGKTTLMAHLVTELRGRGLSVSTIKSTHHDVDPDPEGTDSHRHRKAGAEEVILLGPNRWVLTREIGPADPDQPGAMLESLLARLSPVDIVLVEGMRHAPHPRIEVARIGTRRPLLCESIASIEALAVPGAALPGENAPPGLPLLDLDDVAAIADHIIAAAGRASSRLSRDG